MCGCNISNIFELRLLLYIIMVVNSPIWMNMVIMCVLVVEQLINMCGL